MATVPEPPRTERVKLGGSRRVLLVVEAAPLLLRMAEVVRSIPGLQLAGAFRTQQDVVDWVVWDRQGWQLAFVDLGLREDGANEVIRQLLSRPRAGSVVALGDHLWQETRASCAAMGVYHLLEKGDLVAFRGFLEARLQ